MRIKKGQTIYYFMPTGEYVGKIYSGVVKNITKDLTTGHIDYEIESGLNIFGYTRRLNADQIYTSKKKIESEYKDELRYGAILSKLREVEKLLYETIDKCKDKINEELKINGQCIAISEDNTSFRRDLYIAGIGNVGEEISKMRKDIESLKKRFKSKSKKPVIDKKKEEKGEKK